MSQTKVRIKSRKKSHRLNRLGPIAGLVAAAGFPGLAAAPEPALLPDLCHRPAEKRLVGRQLSTRLSTRLALK